MRVILFLLALAMLFPAVTGLHPYNSTDLNQPIYSPIGQQGPTPQTYGQEEIVPIKTINNVSSSYQNIDLNGDGNITITPNKKNSTITLGLNTPFLTQLITGLDTNFQTFPDFNKQYYSIYDLNAQFVPYIGATKNVNLGANDLNVGGNVGVVGDYFSGGSGSFGMASTFVAGDAGAFIGSFWATGSGVVDSGDLFLRDNEAKVYFGNNPASQPMGYIGYTGYGTNLRLKADNMGDGNIDFYPDIVTTNYGKFVSTGDSNFNAVKANNFFGSFPDINQQFVPYIGATKAVNLGSQNFTTTGTGTFGTTHQAIIGSDGSYSFYGIDGTTTTTLNNGVYAGTFNNAGTSAWIADGVYGVYAVDGTHEAWLSDGVQAGYFTDGTRTVSLADGSYAINATGYSIFDDGTYTAQLTGGTEAGYFTDGTKTVYLVDGTEAGYFSDGTRTVYLADGTSGAYLADGSLTTYINNGTYGFNTNGIIYATNVIETTTNFACNGSSGITDSTSYWLCTASDCSTSCQVTICGGIITGCT